MTDRLASALLQVMRWSARSDVRRRVWALQGTSLSPAEFSVLITLKDREPMRLTALAADQGLDRSTLSPQVRKLEKLGLIGRTGDPEDARATLLTLTEVGENTTEEMMSSATALLGRTLSDWSAQDRDALARLLQRLADDLSREDFVQPVQ